MDNDNTAIFVGDGPEKTYHDALKEGVFLIQKCNSCSEHIFFPRVICTHCGSSDILWVEPKGTGTVYSTTILRRRPESGGNLNISLIDLDEGPRMMSRVEGLAPEDVKIGMRVKSQIIHDSQKDIPLVIFQPLEEL